MRAEERLIIAIDEDDVAAAMNLVEALRDSADTFKIGLTTFMAAGPGIVLALNKMDRKVFVDLKLFDIPAQVAGAAGALTRLGPSMMTVHALGGVEMMKAAVEAAAETAARTGGDRPLMLGVTIPTSLDNAWLARLGMPDTGASAGRLAAAAREAGLDGVVASAGEAAAIRRENGPEFRIVVPGIRPGKQVEDDQKRVASPAEAVAAGADYIVVGRPVTRAADPVAAAREILRSMS